MRSLESKPTVLGLLKDLPDKLLEMDQNQYGLITQDEDSIPLLQPNGLHFIPSASS